MTSALRAKRVSGLPVVDAEGIVVGVISETDLLTKRAMDRRPGWLPGRKHVATAELTAADLMTRPAVTTSSDELVSSVARLMSSRKLRRVPVVDSQGHLLGIVCRSDVLSVFSRPDEDIRREITQDVILDGFFTDPARLTVTVKDGIVTLEGGRDSFYAVDYAARTASELGADLVKVNFPEPGKQSSVPEPYRREISPQDAIDAVVRSANRTLLLVSGGEHAGDEAMLEKTRQSMEAGATGLIFGRNVFQRSHDDSLRLVAQLKAILVKYPSPAARAAQHA
jgi:predicted transcriptional regulator